MDYTQLASKEATSATVEALTAKGYEPITVKNRAEALEEIKKHIPKGASVMNGASTTLQEIGFIDYLKGGQHGWNNLHEAIVNEKDTAKQGVLRRQALLSDYYLGSVSAIAQTGEMLFASQSGSQLPHLAYSSQNLILVASTNKLVPTSSDMHKRLTEHVVPLEDARMKAVYGPQSGTKPNKVLVFNGEAAYLGRQIHIILVEEKLGF